MKRLLDAMVSLLMLVVLSPVMLLVALVSLLVPHQTVIFRQARPGLNGKLFTIYKFASMTNKRGPDGKLLPDAERLTGWGRFLRKTSLDELPQLFNVLKGDLSLVGPRPLLPEYLELYSDDQIRRHNVRPGITGWAQVNGRNAVSWEKKFEYDVWYVDNQSFWLDLKILFMTVMKVLRGHGVTQNNNATTERFRGNKQ